uniref:Cysteine-rich repeat secretory protein 11 n=1 Tax=Anthurium amnicola TaxID=1678845 RepID=A0A1D1Y257_9ARAE
MGTSKTLLPSPLFLSPPLLLLAAAVLALLLAPTSAADLYELVYKGCANQTFPSGGLTYQQALASLSSTLIAQSATSKFYKTTASAAGAGQASLSGLFQCRGDLGSSDCASCVRRIPAMWASLCGLAVAARVQLNGCYGLYEISGFRQVSGTKMLYKVCGSGGGGGGFEEKRDTALANLESAMATGSDGGFHATSYGNVYVMGQCEGDLSVADCGECVTEAVQKAEVECGGASSAQAYLHKCYISYSYYPNGAPRGGGGGGASSGQPTGKTVAIVVGGAAGLGFIVVCLLFVRSLYKKKDGY